MAQPEGINLPGLETWLVDRGVPIERMHLVITQIARIANTATCSIDGPCLWFRGCRSVAIGEWRAAGSITFELRDFFDALREFGVMSETQHDDVIVIWEATVEA